MRPDANIPLKTTATQRSPKDPYFVERGKIVSILLREGYLAREHLAHAVRIRTKLNATNSLLTIIKELKYIGDDQISKVIRENRYSINIGEFLWELGYISETDYQAILKIQDVEQPNRKLIEILVAGNFISDEDLVKALSKHLGFPFIEPKFSQIDPSLFNRVQPEWYDAHRCIPIQKKDSGIIVAFADPMDKASVEASQKVFGKNIFSVIARQTFIDAIIHKIRLCTQFGQNDSIDDKSVEWVVSTGSYRMEETNTFEENVDSLDKCALQQKKFFLEMINDYLTSDKTQLPAFDMTAFRIQQEVAKEDSDIGLIEKLIINDQALTGQVLKVANSSFYKGRVKVATVRNAITRIGIKEVANIVMLVTQQKNYNSKDEFIRMNMNKLWRHSMGCAIGAHWLAQHCEFQRVSHEAFFAGLLHDVGKLLILKVVEDIRRSGKLGFEPSEAFVYDVMSRVHTAQGYSLLQNWNLPEKYCVVARDHDAEEVDTENVLLLMVRLANKTCHKLGIGLFEDSSILLTSMPEAQILNLTEVDAANLEIALEDSYAFEK
ncbi:MAG: HDOD domain-containing protein [Planctomycetota bacterium]|jgi:HD-like signal output (HDOD) protein